MRDRYLKIHAHKDSLQIVLSFGYSLFGIYPFWLFGDDRRAFCLVRGPNQSRYAHLGFFGVFILDHRPRDL